MATTAPSAEPSPSSPSSSLSLGDPSPSNLLEAVDKLKFFLATAPSTFPASPSSPPAPDEDRALNRFLLPTGELISCVLWNGLYHITGTDIVRALNFRFLAFGRPVRNTKKFEEGVFSDLRNLKSGTDATLEEPKSEFLELLFKHNCIRTQKKQKVFYWFSVPHDRLFLDALDRDLKREKLGQESTTEAVREPALSFRWNPNKSLFDQFTTATLDPLSLPDERSEDGPPAPSVGQQSPALPLFPVEESDFRLGQHPAQDFDQPLEQFSADQGRDDAGSNVFGAFSLFEGSPAYKQRRRPLARRNGGSLSKRPKARLRCPAAALVASDSLALPSRPSPSTLGWELKSNLPAHTPARRSSPPSSHNSDSTDQRQRQADSPPPPPPLRRATIRTLHAMWVRMVGRFSLALLDRLVPRGSRIRRAATIWAV
uniref:Uncharacterized protein n=1 Tax=Leucosporidium scottii TaxID=5278 RepID=A0A0H5FUJ4_9BASI|nr:hypothetical protein ls5930a1_00176 [Leucosporidium scottii]